MNPTKNETESNENKSNKKTITPQNNEDITQSATEKVEKEEPVVEQETITPQTNGVVLVASNSYAKEKKKKKNEQNTIQQLGKLYFLLSICVNCKCEIRIFLNA